MVDFRKWLIAFAAAALLFGLGSSQANAQVAQPFICNATAGNPHIVRSEGVAELVGDLVLNCTGGAFTPAGQIIPPSNVQINLNTNVTSRLTGAAPSLDSEAILAIDEPFPGTTPPGASGQSPAPPTAVPVIGASTTQLGCVANGTDACLAVTSLGWGFGATGSYSGAAGHPNLFQGLVNPSAPSQINWQGVPIDAPGTTINRIIRITNVRANACMLGVSSTLVPATITELIGVSGSQTIIINNPLQTVALVEKGLLGSVNAPFGAPTYTQCNNLNDFLITGAPGSPSTLSLTATEGFAAAFKTGVAFQAGAGVFVQNVLGYSYNTESGYVPFNVSGLDQTNTKIGLADTGTEVSFNLTGIGAGVSLFAPTVVNLVDTNTGAITGEAALVGSLAGGVGSSFNPPAASSALSPITISGTTASVTYEILADDPNTIEALTIPLAVAFVTTSPTVPASGPASVSINYAPLSTSTQNVSSSTAPIPRFCQPYGPSTAFTIVPCTCNLLFPFVTNQAGFDTGVAIANTSQDPYGTVAQAGTVTLWYYGTSTGSATPPPPATSTSVPAGQVLTFEVSSGGSYGIPATAGFQGYIIAQANFQFCHGYAFISDVGAEKLAEGYLAISLDTASEIAAIQANLGAFGGPARGGPGGTATPPVAGEDHGH